MAQEQEPHPEAYEFTTHIAEIFIWLGGYLVFLVTAGYLVQDDFILRYTEVLYGIGGLLGFCGILTILTHIRTRIDDRGITRTNLWGRVVFTPWSAIGTIRYSSGGACFTRLLSEDVTKPTILKDRCLRWVKRPGHVLWLPWVRFREAVHLDPPNGHGRPRPGCRKGGQDP